MKLRSPFLFFALVLSAFTLSALHSPALAQPSGATGAAGTAGKTSATGKAFAFAAIGDAPYGEQEAVIFKDLLQEIGHDTSRFVLHAGDIKSGTESCADELLLERKQLLDQARQPLILVPGDNEWTDCHRISAGQYNPTERLQRLRDLFFADEYSLGQEKLRLVRQSEMAKFRSYRENVRWEYNGILFIGLNLPGSNNNYQTAAGRNGEFDDRLIANRVWLQRAFAHARQRRMKGIVILVQANPDFEHTHHKNGRDGYSEFRLLLAAQVSRFAGRVLLIHGDSHRFQVNQPLHNAQGKVLSNFTRVEVFGSPFINHWVRIKVDPARSALFEVETRTLAPHSAN